MQAVGKRAWVALLVSDKIDFNIKMLATKRRIFYNVKNNQEDTTFININASSNRAFTYMKQTLNWEEK